MKALLRRIHRWLGLALALPLLLQGLSGTILTLEPVFSELAPRGGAAGKPHEADAIIAAATAAVPDGLRAARYAPANNPGDAASVHFVPQSGPQGGAGIAVRIDPVSLAVLALEQGPRGMLGLIKAFHTNLLTTDRSGRSIVGWLGVGLLLLAALGIPLWWPAKGQWRAGFTIDPNARGVWFHRRFHGAVGIWTLGLLLATASTGVVLAFPQTMRSALGLPDAAQARASRVAPSGSAVPTGLESAIALAREASPGARVRMVSLPSGASEPVRIMLAPAGTDGVATMLTVTVDAAGRRILAIQDARSLPVPESLLRWAHDLHFGQGFGPIWRALTVITGVVLPIFAITGWAMWLIRRNRRRRTAIANRTALQVGE